MSQKGFAPILIIVSILVVGLVASGAYYLGTQNVFRGGFKSIVMVG